MHSCAILLLSKKDSFALQKHIVAQGALPSIIRAMETHPGDASLQQEGCAVLMNLARQNALHRNLIRDAGGQKLARAALKRHRNALDVEHYAQW